jgi:hypothetical protein
MLSFGKISFGFKIGIYMLKFTMGAKNTIFVSQKFKFGPKLPLINMIINGLKNFNFKIKRLFL